MDNHKKNKQQPHSAPKKWQIPDFEPELNRIRELHEKLQDKLDSLYKAAGLTYEDVRNYLSNPKNFSKEEWQVLQQFQLEYEEKLKSQLNPNFVKQREVKKKKLSGKKLRGKMIGRKRNWLEMD